MELLLLMTLGLVAGLLGGLLGIGGSVIMIPVLLWLLPETDYQMLLAAATAMTVNPAVAVGAATRHQQNANVSWRTFWMVLPLSVVFISVAAWYSADIPDHWLKFYFGLFLLFFLWNQIATLVKQSDCELLHTKNSSRSGVEKNVDGIIRTSITGTVTGAISGLLAIGGGLVRVPLLNTLCKLPMKLAIGTSSAIMFITAIVGATFARCLITVRKWRRSACYYACIANCSRCNHRWLDRRQTNKDTPHAKDSDWLCSCCPLWGIQFPFAEGYGLNL